MFNPQAGHEQAGRRPALVLSPARYNERSGLALMCAVTSEAKGYPFEVPLPAGCGVSGVVLSDHCKSLDFQARRAELIGPVPAETIEAVRRLLFALLGS